jgi:hypothetical protein
MLATARAYHATLRTQDADFQGLEGVQKAYVTEPPNQALHRTLDSAGELWRRLDAAG